MIVTLALVGLGGYGLVYLEGLLDKKRDSDFKIVAGIDPEPNRCTRLQELHDMKVPIFRSLEEFFQQGSADLVILSSPIQMHCPQTCLALSHDSNVLCEKPLGATIQEVSEMIKAHDKANRFVAIGYQWSFSDTIQELKKDIKSGVLGAPKRFETVTLWPRDEAYYARNTWAGKQKDENGNWVLDSPANNALAHFLHNMFYILGDEVDTSARPSTVVAELYRANPIENFDTFAARAYTESGVEILFYGSHACEKNIGPIITYEFEKAIVNYSGENSDFIARFKDGSQKKYGTPDRDHLKKMWDAIRAVRTGEKIVCGIEASSSQTLCANGMQESMPKIVNFPNKLVREKDVRGNKLIYIEGLENDFIQCFKENALPNELELGWSERGKEIALTDYTYYPRYTVD